MDIDAPLARRIQNRLRQDQTIGHHHRHIRIKRGEIGLRDSRL